MASVLLYLDPPEICALARLNRTFRGAASADSVWETKLPTNYGYLLEKARAFEEEEGEEKGGRGKGLGFGSKKEMYARLCRPNPFDGGTKVRFLTLFDVDFRDLGFGQGSDLLFVRCFARK